MVPKQISDNNPSELRVRGDSGSASAEMFNGLPQASESEQTIRGIKQTTRAGDCFSCTKNEVPKEISYGCLITITNSEKGTILCK